MPLLLESGCSELWRGDILRLPESYLGPGSGPVDLLVYDPRDDSCGLGLMAASGYKAGLIWSILPIESRRPDAIRIDMGWLRRHRRRRDPGPGSQNDRGDALMPTVAPLDLEGHVLGAHFLGDIPFFASSAGSVHRLDMGHQVTEANNGLLASVTDPLTNSVITSGEDGKIFRITADGTAKLVAEEPRKWITSVAAGPSGAVGYATGKVATVVTSDGKSRSFTEQRSVEGVAFAPKGLRLAAAFFSKSEAH